ncbi:NADPH oxidase organizer 1 [Xenopus laevis]|uniref:NADPH oxidase organizer 1 n=2 Tax=Xenopus laevis TaxID=8355 RepID=A0A974C0N8_XENLA|nr:NADPH oxidase organizer 1 [Xenopus laevis]OCT64453.1 hypothetical protein XELAEV_18045552mg [Xenopus laevis]
MKQSSSRHPVEVQGVGLMHHGNHKTYMFSVLWSDHIKVLIYRTVEEFTKFQKELKRKFPLEAGAMKKSERTIPKLKDALRRGSKKKDSRKYLERLRQLETYCCALLKLDAKISQCPIMVQFFTLHNNDLNPSFPENSLVIMPSDTKEERSICQNQNFNVSGPLVSLTYLCTADFETVDLRNKPFTAKKHELLDVLVKESTGWWLVENEDRQIAWFPAPYLKAHRNTEDGCGNQACQEGTFCVVLKAYEAQNFDEISIGIGVIVEVLEKSDNGWWLIRYNRRSGYIPSIYLKPYRNPCEKFKNILGRDLHISTPNLYEGRDEIMKEDRDRSQSVGDASVTSNKSSSIASDLDSSSSPSVSDGESSAGGSNTSLSAIEPAFRAPKIPARPKPNEILQNCSTVTKRTVQKILVQATSP